ncbi:MAG: DNA-binding transcriptional regulator GbsR (MarR family) [Granulosicoccus sp.]|jgi:DNA-binding transcriptional regulator GbsR (MarR family)
MLMTPMIQSFVLHFGEMGSRWGINRTVAQIYALLVMSESSLYADQVAETLKISRGNVSMGIKELQSWRLVRVQHIPGDRKDYYSALGDVWDMARAVFQERRKREIDPTLSVLRHLLIDAPTNDKDKYAQTRMEEIYQLMEMFTLWSDELQDMKPENLQTLMKMGAGVSKVINFKNKLTSSTGKK